ncbi:MAG: hypothetical protein RBT71_14345, partial [Flavobacteriales bacterium]|nr:hypothetical protein [Flavobacteriales bacterium]
VPRVVTPAERPGSAPVASTHRVDQGVRRTGMEIRPGTTVRARIISATSGSLQGEVLEAVNPTIASA